MNNNGWITDRLPTEADADSYGWVWITTYKGEVVPSNYSFINENTPWTPIAKPEPYVNKPKRYTVKWLTIDACWAVMEMHYVATRLTKLNCECDEHREAAERIAAIYEEVMP